MIPETLLDGYMQASLEFLKRLIINTYRSVIIKYILLTALNTGIFAIFIWSGTTPNRNDLLHIWVSGAGTSFIVFCMIHVDRLSNHWLVLVFKCCAALINSSSCVGWKRQFTG